MSIVKLLVLSVLLLLPAIVRLSQPIAAQAPDQKRLPLLIDSRDLQNTNPAIFADS